MSVDECPKSFCSYWAAVNMTPTREVIGWNGNIHPGFFLKCSQNAEKERKRWWNLRAKAQSACGVDGSDSPVWQEPSRDPSCYSWPKAWPGSSDLFLRDYWVCFYWAGLDPKQASSLCFVYLAVTSKQHSLQSRLYRPTPQCVRHGRTY